MAATVSAWSKPGAWALHSEENEAELLMEAANPPLPTVAAAADFPSLAAAAKQKKKKKAQTLSLAEFAAPQIRIGRTHEDLVVLPTGPRERTAEELDRTRLGGGFKTYGSTNARHGDSREDNSSRWGGSSRVSDDSRRNRDSGREFAPSRADETDNWASAKKPIGGGAGIGFERRERGGGFFSDSQSKADEVDSWVSNKTFTPSEGRRFGGGFDNRSSFESLSNGERKGSSDSLSNGSGADSDNWGRRRSNIEESNGGGGGARPKLVLQPRTLPVESKEEVVVKDSSSSKGASNPFGAARPREEVLKEKGVDLNEIEKKFEAAKVADKEEKPDAKKGGFGNGWFVDKGERAWRKPQSPSSTPLSAEKNEDGHADEN